MYTGYYEDEDGTGFVLTKEELRDISFKYIMEIVTNVDKKKLSNEQEKWLDRCAFNELNTAFFNMSKLSTKELLINKLEEIERDELKKKEQEERYNKYFKTEEN